LARGILGSSLRRIQLRARRRRRARGGHRHPPLATWHLAQPRAAEMPKKMGVNTKAEAARARRGAAEAEPATGRRALRRRPTGRRQRAPSRARRAAARRTPRSAPRTAASRSSSSSSSPPRRSAPTARPRAWAGPPFPRSPRPSRCMHHSEACRSRIRAAVSRSPPLCLGLMPPSIWFLPMLALISLHQIFHRL
ncbi:hypothetical protein BAE44_0009720, partial [Dichanthelium oligosanthes]